MHSTSITMVFSSSIVNLAFLNTFFRHLFTLLIIRSYIPPVHGALAMIGSHLIEWLNKNSRVSFALKFVALSEMILVGFPRRPIILLSARIYLSDEQSSAISRWIALVPAQVKSTIYALWLNFSSTRRSFTYTGPARSTPIVENGVLTETLKSGRGGFILQLYGLPSINLHITHFFIIFLAIWRHLGTKYFDFTRLTVSWTPLWNTLLWQSLTISCDSQCWCGSAIGVFALVGMSAFFSLPWHLIIPSPSGYISNCFSLRLKVASFFMYTWADRIQYSSASRTSSTVNIPEYGSFEFNLSFTFRTNLITYAVTLSNLPNDPNASHSITTDVFIITASEAISSLTSRFISFRISGVTWSSLGDFGQSCWFLDNHKGPFLQR